MFRLSRSESGQISILVLVVAVALLAGTFVIAAVAEVLITQQRLNAKAEAVALAGALELEFNQDQACTVAREFSTANFGLEAECGFHAASIEILLSETNPNRFLRIFIANIQASSRSGIASGE